MTQSHNSLQVEIRARARAEQELRLARQELEQRVQEQTQKYRDSERKYRNLVEGTSNLIAHLDQRGDLTFINRAARNLFGLEEEEYRGVSIFRFIHPNDHNRVRQWWNSCIADNTKQTFLELHHLNAKTGENLTLQWSAALQYDETGTMTGMGVIGRNISEIKRVEQNYINLFTEMLDGFALHEIICRDGKPVDYRFLSINPAFETQTGLKADDLLGKTVREVMPEIEQHWIDTYGKVALTGEPVTFENYLQAMDKYFEVNAYCPAPNQFACIFQDITFRKKAEQEKAILETQLRQRHKMEAIGTLAGGIAHDFNNILSAILGYADMALEEIPESSPAKKQIEEVRKAGNRAKDLVKQILAFSRKDGQRRESIRLNTLIEEVVDFLKATLPATIHLELDLAPDCGNILANQTQMHRVLMNICTNGIQSMEGQEGTLSLALQEVELNERDLGPVATLSPGKYLSLKISDTGTGIGEEYHDRIFDPYFTTKEFGKGSGLGLAVVQGIVKSHGGMIKFSSNLDHGTSFSLYFPVTKETTQPIESPSKVQGRQGSERILIVDDDPSITAMLQAMLERLDYEVHACTCGKKALELYLADPDAFDLIITDQTMPTMTGQELAKEILRVRPELPIILCSGYSDQLDETKAAGAGFKVYLNKPVNLKELTGRVRQLLEDGNSG